MSNIISTNETPVPAGASFSIFVRDMAGAVHPFVIDMGGNVSGVQVEVKRSTEVANA